jgi:hypothetical protein
MTHTKSTSQWIRTALNIRISRRGTKFIETGRKIQGVKIGVLKNRDTEDLSAMKTISINS